MLEEKASGALDSMRGLAQGSCLESEICLPLKCRLYKESHAHRSQDAPKFRGPHLPSATEVTVQNGSHTGTRWALTSPSCCRNPGRGSKGAGSWTPGVGALESLGEVMPCPLKGSVSFWSRRERTFLNRMEFTPTTQPSPKAL